jgi:hypothetical protein
MNSNQCLSCDPLNYRKEYLQTICNCEQGKLKYFNIKIFLKIENFLKDIMKIQIFSVPNAILYAKNVLVEIIFRALRVLMVKIRKKKYIFIIIYLK